MDVVEGVLEGAVDIDLDGGVAVAEQLWDVVQSILLFSNALMTGLFESLGVQGSEFSYLLSHLSSIEPSQKIHFWEIHIY